jgi:hypothetical protein
MKVRKVLMLQRMMERWLFLRGGKEKLRLIGKLFICLCMRNA